MAHWNQDYSLLLDLRGDLRSHDQGEWVEILAQYPDCALRCAVTQVVEGHVAEHKWVISKNKASLCWPCYTEQDMWARCDALERASEEQYERRLEGGWRIYS